MTATLAASPGLEEATTLLAQVVGLALLAATLAGVAAFAYRWYVRESVPTGLALLVGLSGVAVYLSTTTILGEVIGGDTGPTDVQEALFHIVAFAGATVAAGVGRRAGDRFAADVFSDTGRHGVETDVGRLVRSVGRVVSVELPAHIHDVVGYDPVPEETKEALAGKRFVFPRKLTVADLESRLVSRLKTDYAVGHVDVELAEDGSVEYLALGSRAAGIGPTLPPATNAVAVRADPAFAASAGDLVQVWETDPMRRVLTAELRGASGDVVTLAIDAADTSKVDPTTRYKLVTLPVDDRPDREFASLLRAADETFSSVTVEAGSPLHGMPVGAIAVTVVSVQGDAAEPAVLPRSDYVLDAGDVVHAIARPETLRRLEAAAEPLAPAIESGVEPGSGTGDGATSDDAGDSSLAEALTAPPAEDEPDEELAPSTDESTGSGDRDPDSDRVGGQADASNDGPFTDVSDSGGAERDDDSGSANVEDVGTDDGEDSRDEPDAAPNDSEEFDDLGDDLAELGDDLDALGDDLDEMDDFGAPDASDAADFGFDEGDTDDATSDESDGSEDDDPDEDADDSPDDVDENGEDDGDDEEASSDGGKSFAQLKAEFDSGEADWEDDISDSPGGDMRLDE